MGATVRIIVQAGAAAPQRSSGPMPATHSAIGAGSPPSQAPARRPTKRCSCPATPASSASGSLKALRSRMARTGVADWPGPRHLGDAAGLDSNGLLIFLTSFASSASCVNRSLPSSSSNPVPSFISTIAPTARSSPTSGCLAAASFRSTSLRNRASRKSSPRSRAIFGAGAVPREEDDVRSRSRSWPAVCPPPSSALQLTRTGTVDSHIRTGVGRAGAGVRRSGG